VTQPLNAIHLQRLLKGNVFIVSEKKSLSSGAETNIHLENPSNSGARYILLSASVQSTGPFDAHVHDKFDSITAGTQEVVHASRAGKRNNTPLNAYSDSTHTPDGTHSYAVVGAGGGGSSASGGEASGNELVLTDGSDVVMHVTNNANETREIVLTFIVAQIVG